MIALDFTNLQTRQANCRSGELGVGRFAPGDDLQIARGDDSEIARLHEQAARHAAHFEIAARALREVAEGEHPNGRLGRENRERIVGNRRRSEHFDELTIR